MLSGCLLDLEFHPFFLFSLFISPRLVGGSGTATLASSGGGGGGGCTTLLVVSSVKGGGGGGGDGGGGGGMKTCAVLSIATLILIVLLLVKLSRQDIQRHFEDRLDYGLPRQPLAQI